MVQKIPKSLTIGLITAQNPLKMGLFEFCKMFWQSETIFHHWKLSKAKINPLKTSHELTEEECKKITHASKKILKSAIKVGGTTLKDFYSADGSPGYFKIKLNVYGRDGQPCRKCKKDIKKINLNQRTTYFCSKCQI